MPYTITLLPFEKQFTCGDNETILQAAIRQGFNLRYGCKHGGCGMCKAQVVEGDVDNTEASSFALLDFERQQGFSLLCCAYPESDVSIELWDYDEADLVLRVSPFEQFEAEVEQITSLTHDIRGIHLRLITPERIEFKAGQYIDLLVPGTTEWRSYSMANPPSRNAHSRDHGQTDAWRTVLVLRRATVATWCPAHAARTVRQFSFPRHATAKQSLSPVVQEWPDPLALA